MKKELRELINIESVLSMVLVVAIFVGLGFMIGQQTESASEPPVFGLVNLDNELDSEYSDLAISVMENAYLGAGVEDPDQYIIRISVDGTVEDGEELISKMKELGIESTLVIDENFTANIKNGTKGEIRTYYIAEGAGMMEGLNSDLTGLIQRINAVLSEELITNDPVNGDYAFLSTPVKFKNDGINTYINGKIITGITPSDINGALMTQTFMIPIVIMIVIMVVGSILISSMGNEKENKTLETLLTLPVKRTTIVTGKILASAIMGLIYGGVYMAGMYVYMGSMTAGIGDVDLSEIGLVLGPVEWIVTMLVMFVSIMCALGLCMILGAFVKSYKGAQTMTLPISVLAMIPMFIFMLSDWNSLGVGMRAIMFAIPFSHPMMVMQNLLFGNVLLVLAGLAYCTLFAIASILITVKLYNSDILLVGLGSTKLGRFLAKFKKAD